MSAQVNNNPANDENATAPGQPGNTQTPSYNHVAEQVQSIVSQIPDIMALANKLHTSPEHHEDFSQNPADVAKQLTGWQVPNGMDVTHNPAANSVTLSQQLPISSSSPHSDSGQDVPPSPTVNFNLTVNINSVNINTVNIALGIPSHADLTGIPGHADFSSPAQPNPAGPGSSANEVA